MHGSTLISEVLIKRGKKTPFFLEVPIPFYQSKQSSYSVSRLRNITISDSSGQMISSLFYLQELQRTFSMRTTLGVLSDTDPRFSGAVRCCSTFQFLYARLETGRIMRLGMAGGRPHRFPHNNFSSVYRIFTKVGHMIPLQKGKNPIYFGVIRSKVKVTVTIHRIFDNRVVST